MAFQGTEHEAGGRFCRGSRVLSTEIDGETVILALDAGVYHSLEGVAARIWELLESPSTVDEMASLIASQYGVPVEQCQPDIQEFFDDLLRAELVVVQPR